MFATKKVATDPMIGAQMGRFGHYLSALVHHLRTARREGAARGGIDQGWNLTTRLDRLGGEPTFGIGDS